MLTLWSTPGPCGTAASAVCWKNLEKKHRRGRRCHMIFDQTHLESTQAARTMSTLSALTYLSPKCYKKRSY
jgi:hypothetical protein